MQAPKKVSLGQLTADIIEAEILSGRWQSHLPGYRVLCERAGVSRRTMEQAFQILTQKKVLLPPSGKKPRQINPELTSSPASAPVTKALILSAQPMQEMNFATRSIIEQTTAILARKGWHTDFHANSEYASNSPGPVMHRMAQNRRNHTWILLAPRTNVIQWCLEQNITFICLGGDKASTPHPLIAVQQRSVLKSAFQQLITTKHKRISILHPPTSFESYTKIVVSLEQLHQQAHLPFHSSYNLPRIESYNAAHFQEVLDQLFSLSPPDALIVTDVKFLIALYSYCQKNSIRIPEDLSVISTAEDPNLDWFFPKPAHFQFPLKQFVSKLTRWIESPPPIETAPAIFEVKYQPGHSIRTRL